VAGPLLARPAVDLDGLRQQMLEHAGEVRRIFVGRIGSMGDVT
jgi:hypothetical protein